MMRAGSVAAALLGALAHAMGQKRKGNRKRQIPKGSAREIVAYYGALALGLFPTLVFVRFAIRRWLQRPNLAWVAPWVLLAAVVVWHVFFPYRVQQEGPTEQ